MLHSTIINIILLVKLYCGIILPNKNLPIVWAKAGGQRGNITITGFGNGVNHCTETYCLVRVGSETMRKKDDLPG